MLSPLAFAHQCFCSLFVLWHGLRRVVCEMSWSLCLGTGEVVTHAIIVHRLSTHWGQIRMVSAVECSEINHNTQASLYSSQSLLWSAKEPGAVIIIRWVILIIPFHKSPELWVPTCRCQLSSQCHCRHLKLTGLKLSCFSSLATSAA